MSVGYGAAERSSWRTAPGGAVDLKLLAVKALVVGLVLGGLALARVVYISPLVMWGRLASSQANVELRYPKTWKNLTSVADRAHIFRDGAHVWLSRVAWSDLELVGSRFLFLEPRPTAPVDRSNPLPYLAWYLRLDAGPEARIVQTRLGGRRATMIVGRYNRSYRDGAEKRMRPPWGAVVVAPGPDLLYLQLYARTQEELEAVWRDWIRMVRRVRIIDASPVEPLFGVLAED